MEKKNKEGVWEWLSFAPEHRIILAAHVGPRTKESAKAIIDKTDKVLDGELPLFVSDGLKLYIETILEKYHYLKEYPKTGKRGRPRKPKKKPLSQLKYAQIIKKRKKGNVVGSKKKIIYGDDKEISEEDISTSYIERQNLTLRQENHRLARKTLGYSKSKKWLRHQSVLYKTYYNFVRTHDALKIKSRKKISEHVWQKYEYRTPAMSAGITNHVWSLNELLRFPYHKTSTN